MKTAAFVLLGFALGVVLILVAGWPWVLVLALALIVGLVYYAQRFLP